LSALSVLVGGLVVYALWHSEQTMAGGVITSGNLNLELGQATWADLTPAGASNWDGQSGSDLGQLTTYYSTPGDGVELRQEFSVHGLGNNLEVELALTSTADPAGTPPGSRVAYKVLEVAHDGSEAELAPSWTPLGQALTVPDLGAGDHKLVLLIQWHHAGTPQVTQDLDAASPLTTRVFDFVLAANQVRGGP
jgi:alternate signal-mediated exported protein